MDPVNPENVQNPAPMPGSPEHDAAMVAKFQASQTPEGIAPKPKAEEQTPAPKKDDEKPQVPDWVPEEFRSAEDPMKAMAEAYAKLKAPAAAETPPAADQTTQANSEKELAAAGVDMAALQATYDKDGKLGDADYESLSKAGFSKEVVDGYIAGQEALAAQFRGQITAAIGGEEGWSKLTAWASKSVPQAELVAFNEVMDSGNVDQCKLAVQGLYSRFTAAQGQEPKNLLGGAGVQSQGDTFRSIAELTAAMRDPRYSRDPAYRQDVEERLSRSKIM